MDKAKLKEYADIQLQIRALEKRVDELKPEIKEMLSVSGADKVTTEFGNFTLGSRTTWKYSEDVERLQEKEKAMGIAKSVTSVSLTYTAPKAVTLEDGKN